MSNEGDRQKRGNDKERNPPFFQILFFIPHTRTRRAMRATRAAKLLHGGGLSAAASFHFFLIFIEKGGIKPNDKKSEEAKERQPGRLAAMGKNCRWDWKNHCRNFEQLNRKGNGRKLAVWPSRATRQPLARSGKQRHRRPLLCHLIIQKNNLPHPTPLV